MDEASRLAEHGPSWRQELVSAVAAQLARLPEPAAAPANEGRSSPDDAQRDKPPVSCAQADEAAAAGPLTASSPASAYVSASPLAFASAVGPGGPDLFSLLAELAALRQEVRSQNRTQERSRRAMEQVQADIQASLAGQRLALDVAERALQEGNSWRSRVQLAPLLDLRDMLERAIGHAAAPLPRPWWRRWQAEEDRGRASLEAIRAALDRTLAQLGLVPFAAAGDLFDPQTMVAIGRTDDPLAADGTVTQVARGGFTCNQQLIRSAEVVVKRQALGEKVIHHDA